MGLRVGGLICVECAISIRDEDALVAIQIWSRTCSVSMGRSALREAGG